MKQQMRFGSEAPRWRTHSRYGMQPCAYSGTATSDRSWQPTATSAS